MDENSQPVAVQIDYQDWLEIERMLQSQTQADFDWSRFEGSIRLTEDPLEYQRRIRGEWS